MNMLDVQDKLKNLSEEQLVREMQMPSGSAPQFLVLSEITRRKRMRDSLNTQNANGPTVAEEVVASAGVPQGGLASMAQALAPQSSIAQNTGAAPGQGMPQEMPVQGMYEGGPINGAQGDTYLPGLSDEDRAKVMAAADVRAGLHPLYKLLKDEAEAKGVSPEAFMNSFFGQARGEYGSPVDSGFYPAPATSAAPEFLPGLTEEERQKVMLGADMRALGRRSYLADQADKQGVSPEALMGRYGLYETGLAPEPEDPSAPQRRYRDESISAARGMDASGPYAYLFEQDGVDLDLTSVNPSYTEDRPDRFPEEAPRLPMTGYVLPRPDEMTSYERRQNSQLEQPRSWFRGDDNGIAPRGISEDDEALQGIIDFLNPIENAKQAYSDIQSGDYLGAAINAGSAVPAGRGLFTIPKLAAPGVYDYFFPDEEGQESSASPVAMYGGGPVKKMQTGRLVVKSGKRYLQMPDGSLVDESTGQPLSPRDQMLIESSGGSPGLSLGQMYELGGVNLQGTDSVEEAMLAARKRGGLQGILDASLISGNLPDDMSLLLPGRGTDAVRSYEDATAPVAPEPRAVPLTPYELMLQEAAGGFSGFTPSQMEELGPQRQPLARQAQFEPAGQSSRSVMDALRAASAMEDAGPSPRSPYETITQFDFDATGPGGGPIPDDGRTWGQRNIGDPLRDFFQPIGDAARDVGQPIGDYLEEVGRPIGEGAPQFVLGPAPVEPPPVLARQAQFEPVGLSSPSAMDAARQAAAALGAEPRPPTPYDTITRFDTLTEPGAGRVGLATGLPEEEGGGWWDWIKDSLGNTSAVISPFASEAEREAAAAALDGELPPGRLDRDQQGQAAIPTEEEVAAEISAGEDMSPGGDGGDLGGGGSGGTGGAGASGGTAPPMSSYEQELIDALRRSEKRAEQDKWLALAQVGLELMASGKPTIGDALGAAAAKGLGAYREARDTAENERLGLKKGLYELQSQRAAALASQQRAGTRAAGSGAPSLSDLNSALNMLTTEITVYDEDGNERKDFVAIDPADQPMVDQLKEQRSAMIAGRFSPTM